MKTVDISAQMRILQILCAHVQASFDFKVLEVKVRTKPVTGQIVITLALESTQNFKILMRGLGYLRDFSLMPYKAEDWEAGIETALNVLKNTETSVNFAYESVTFTLPTNTPKYRTELQNFLKDELQDKSFQFCSIEKLWKISWAFSERNLILKNATVSSDRIFQFELEDESKEAERLMEECLKGLGFLAKVPDEV